MATIERALMCSRQSSVEIILKRLTGSEDEDEVPFSGALCHSVQFFFFGKCTHSRRNLSHS